MNALQVYVNWTWMHYCNDTKVSYLFSTPVQCDNAYSIFLGHREKYKLGSVPNTVRRILAGPALGFPQHVHSEHGHCGQHVELCMYVSKNFTLPSPTPAAISGLEEVMQKYFWPNLYSPECIATAEFKSYNKSC